MNKKRFTYCLVLQVLLCFTGNTPVYYCLCPQKAGEKLSPNEVKEQKKFTSLVQTPEYKTFFALRLSPVSAPCALILHIS
jgi:hypothetical protein